jgi:hypothetical protein
MLPQKPSFEFAERRRRENARQRLAAAMAVQETRSGVEAVEKLVRFSLDGDDGCIQ